MFGRAVAPRNMRLVSSGGIRDAPTQADRDPRSKGDAPRSGGASSNGGAAESEGTGVLHFAAVLDTLTLGIVIVAEKARILHANRTAQGMLTARRPIAANNGALLVRDRTADRALAHALARAQTGDAAGPGGRAVVALRDETASVAHILPLGREAADSMAIAQAAAVIFITQGAERAAANIDAMAQSFGLTPAEARVLDHVLSGSTLAEAARRLGVSGQTVKTHLAHIFNKTGVSRQAELVALASRMGPPVYWSSDRGGS